MSERYLDGIRESRPDLIASTLYNVIIQRVPDLALLLRTGLQPSPWLPSTVSSSPKSPPIG